MLISDVAITVTPSLGVWVRPGSSGRFPDLGQGDFGSSCLQSQGVTVQGHHCLPQGWRGHCWSPARAGAALQTLVVALGELMVGHV